MTEKKKIDNVYQCAVVVYLNGIYFLSVLIQSFLSVAD